MKMTEEQRERWNKNRRERYANSPEVRERHRLAQEKWVAKKLKANPNYWSDYRKNWRKKKQSLFQQITASPDVLAPKFVYYTVNRDQFGTYYWYCSALIPGEKWSEESEAIAATVAKLKEVESEMS
jgi:hypothetical protein